MTAKWRCNRAENFLADLAVRFCGYVTVHFKVFPKLDFLSTVSNLFFLLIAENILVGLVLGTSVIQYICTLSRPKRSLNKTAGFHWEHLK